MLLESFEPIHGVLLCEGEDIDSSLYDAELTGFSPEELEEIRKLHANVEKELSKKCTDGSERVSPLNYEDYDGHRHAVRIVEDTPLHHWFEDSLEDEKNGNHDGLVEGFYDPDAYNPKEGKFIMGLQFHPERMRCPDSDNFDYPGCSSAYQEFVKAVIAHEKKLNCSAYVPKAPKLNLELETKRKTILRSFSIAKNLYISGHGMISSQGSELIAGAEFLEANTALSLQQENRLKQMGATVRNSSMYLERLMKNEERERLARIIMEKMSIEQLSDLMSLYEMMGQKCSEELRDKASRPNERR
uniref:Uncharacterized protein n=1 Tax=Quercus lobata TaxID=97700 RepID=A0A7N2KLU7_QUELO